MKKYGGYLIHKSRDAFGDIEVIDCNDERSLHFGSRYKQSTMDVKSPEKLHLSYARTMMAALLFNQKPQKFLILGLGAGSLAKFLLSHFKGCQIDAVEYRENVTKIAHGYFKLPEDKNLNILNTDAAMFVHSADHSRYSEYDIIFVDLYDESGPSTASSGESFFQNCKKRLAEKGVFSINLWGSEKQIFRDSAKIIMKTFDSNAMFLDVSRFGNVIGLGINQIQQKIMVRDFKENAKELEQKFTLNFPSFLRNMKKNNQQWFNNVK